MDVTDWFLLLSPAERRNDDTVLDRRHADGRAWTSGNAVTPLVHGAVYYAELIRCLARVRAGDLVLFTDWAWRPRPGPGRVRRDGLSRAVRGGLPPAVC